MTYKFPQFNQTFIDPAFYLNRVNDYIPTKSCYIEICFYYEGEIYSLDFEDFFYEETWSDEECFNFAMTQIEKYKI